MITSQDASALGRVGSQDTRRVRRAAGWLAATAAAVTLAATAGVTVHRVTSSDGTVAPTITTVQPATQHRVPDPSKRLIQINEQAAPAPVPAPAQPRVNRLLQVN
jgi:hypothetical protein